AALFSVLSNQIPTVLNASDSVARELGMKFQSGVPGQINAIRYWKASNETGPHTGHIWSSTGTLLGTVTFVGETSSGWQSQSLATPISIQANTTYVVSVNANFYVATSGGLAIAIVHGNLSSVADGANGVYSSAGTFPTLNFQN